jgi:hypothetical protein
MDLTENERIVLRDVLDMEIEAFEAAMHEDIARAPASKRPQTLEELLEMSSGYEETIVTLNAIRKKVIALDG